MPKTDKKVPLSPLPGGKRFPITDAKVHYASYCRREEMISQTVEYALRAVVAIAQQRGKPCTAQEISTITQVPGPYLSKLMQRMVRAQVVVSKRGLHGGFTLAKDPKELTIWDVIESVDPVQRIHECPLGIDSHAGTLCPLHRRLDAATAMAEESMRSTYVADVLATADSVSPLCQEGSTVQLEIGAIRKKAPATK